MQEELKVVGSELSDSRMRLAETQSQLDAQTEKKAELEERLVKQSKESEEKLEELNEHLQSKCALLQETEYSLKVRG